jgi:hypothetical protein
VRGTVRDDKRPVAGATVLLRNPAIGMGSTNAAYRTTTHADGTYLFGNVPAGKYLLLAADEDDSNLTSDNYEDYADVSVELNVRNDRIVQDLKRHPRGVR